MAVLLQELEIPSSLNSNLIKIILKNLTAVVCLFSLPKKTTDHKNVQQTTFSKLLLQSLLMDDSPGFYSFFIPPQ